jgi:hypothetical protein
MKKREIVCLRINPVLGEPPSIRTQPQSATVAEGASVLFCVIAAGTAPLGYQWHSNGATIPGATSATLLLTNVLKGGEGFYSVVVDNAFGAVTSSNALLDVNRWPVADAGATQPMVISANGADAKVILNGTRSSDPDSDMLRYACYELGSTNPLASGAVAVVVLPVGAHSLVLAVNDGMLEAPNAFTVEVLTTAQAVERLVAQVNSKWSRSQPHIATLSAALASIDRSQDVSAINQLSAFQNKVRAQVAPSDPTLADDLLRKTQEIIDVLSIGAANSGGRPHGRFTSVIRQPNGRVQMQFSAERGPLYILEVSTNLVNWEKAGVAAGNGDGLFEFGDGDALRTRARFYRIVSP